MADRLWLKGLLLAACLLVGTATSAYAATGGASPAKNTTGAETAVEAVLATYEKALNASDTSAVMPLYADDGVFMPPYSHSAVGKAAVKDAYDYVFKTITLHVKFTVAEFVQMAPNWAFVRTNSAGTNTLNATGAQSAEGNQELFIFKKNPKGEWKIERYSFSSTNPPHP